MPKSKKKKFVMQLQMDARVAVYLLCYSLEGKCTCNLYYDILNDVWQEKRFCLKKLNF